MTFSIVVSKIFSLFFELLITHIYSIFIVCLSGAFLSALFLNYSVATVFLFFMPPGILAISFMPLIAVGFPPVCIMYFLKIRKQIYWLLLGGVASVIAYVAFLYYPQLDSDFWVSKLAHYFNLEDVRMLFLPVALAVGLVNVGLLRPRIFKEQQ